MRRITLWLLSTLAAVVLLFSYRTSLGGTATASTGSATASGGGSGTTSGTTSGGTGSDGSGSGTGSDSSGSGSGTGSDGTGSTGGTGSDGTGGTAYNGSVVSTRWGDIQVTITVAGGKITGVTVPVYPDANGKDRQINARALPILNKAVVAAQSADIDTVSGATVTSDGYKESLQAAIDAAHLS
ncbi:FMN-binding protein [Dactylosporangium sp. NPDC050588]|uniref:FMN-binding protein n=1 Tax=Dactylosporangium sp. NPDC050588 TaxID=3157211 RepID=UPI0033D31369